MRSEDKLNYIRITDDKTKVRHYVSFWYILSNEIMWWKQQTRLCSRQKAKSVYHVR